MYNIYMELWLAELSIDITRFALNKTEKSMTSTEMIYDIALIVLAAYFYEI